MSDKPKTIEAQWEGFKDQVMPASAGPGQINDMRVAFFAGALVATTGTITGARHPAETFAEVTEFFRVNGYEYPSGLLVGSSVQPSTKH